MQTFKTTLLITIVFTLLMGCKQKKERLTQQKKCSPHKQILLQIKGFARTRTQTCRLHITAARYLLSERRAPQLFGLM